MFKNNVGMLDRLVRFGLASVLLYLGFDVYGGSALGLGLVIIAIIPALTALIGTCPLYSFLGISTCKVAQSPQQNHKT